MWLSKKSAPIWSFLGWTFLFAYVSYAISIVGLQMGMFTSSVGARVDMVFSTLLGTFSPMYATYAILKRHGEIKSIRDFCRRILHTAEISRTILITSLFAVALLIPALLVGERTDSSFWILIPAIPLMVIGGGVEEIGWRGFLQPALEKKIPFIPATLIVSVIWFAWHVPLWFISSTNQSSYDFLPYLLQLTVMAFVLTAIYKTTKSTIACIAYHAWGNAIGAIYEWKMFATYPIHPILLIYDCLIAAVSIIVILRADKRSTRYIK